MRFHTRSSTTARSEIATMATKVCGRVAERVDREEGEHDRGRGQREEDDRGARADLGPQPVRGDPDEEEDHERARAADGRDRREVDEVGDDEHDRGGDQHPGVRPEPCAAPEEGRELAGPGQHRGEAARGVERGEDRGRGREHGGDRHDREPGVTERRPRRLGDRGLAVADHLGDGQRPEDADRDQHVQHGRDAERAVHGLRQLAGRVAEVAGGERDHAEAEVREEGEGDARDDVGEGRVPAEREQVEVDVDDRDRDEHREDAEEHDDDQRLGAIDDLRTDDVDEHHREHDRRREDVVPDRRGVVSDEQRGRIAPERDRDHRADDHDRGEVAEPGRDADEPTVPEPLHEVGDQPAG